MLGKVMTMNTILTYTNVPTQRSNNILTYTNVPTQRSNNDSDDHILFYIYIYVLYDFF